MGDPQQNIPRPDLSTRDEIEQIQMGKPHVVIVGAGASRAAFPSGDKNGRLLPLMRDFVDIIPISSILKEAGIKYDGKNFEEVYSNICLSRNHDLKQRIDNVVYQYFDELELPDYPTLFDHLILSLREKDVIATFNWDPFLIHAILRSPVPQERLPRLLFLHGNVLLGYCLKDKRTGTKRTRCDNCGEVLAPSALLYPITQKNYTKDPMISLSWEKLQHSFKSAFWVTVFGYSAPHTDVEAINLLRTAWGEWQQRQFEQFEFIDVRPEEEVRKSWSDFIHTHHYEVHADFYESWIPNHPRRTGEAYINQFLEAHFIDENPLPRKASFTELRNWLDRLLIVEAEYRAKKSEKETQNDNRNKTIA